MTAASQPASGDYVNAPTNDSSANTPVADGTTSIDHESQSPHTIGSGINYSLFLDCVHCGLCTAACPTYLETGNENDSPRGRIYLMRSVVDGRTPLTDNIRGHLDLCLDCRSCETACPSGVQYGRLIEPFRVETQTCSPDSKQAASIDWFQRLFLFGLFPHPGRMKLALLPVRVMQSLGVDRIVNQLGLPRLLPERLRRLHEQLPKLQPSASPLPSELPATGARRARVAMFSGCVASTMFGQTNHATARVLQHNGCDVVVPAAQGCCGAIHYHGGASAPALELAGQNLAAFNPDDVDAIIVNVAGCGSMLKDYGHIAEEMGLGDEQRQRMEKFSAKVRDVSEFLDGLGAIKPTGEIPLRATYHDACHLVHAQRVREQPRRLLELIPGLELIPLAESEVCCGAAGTYNLTQPEMADRLGQRKVDHIRTTKAQAVITGNAGCSLQIQASLRRSGIDLPVYHPVDLLDASYRGVELSR